MTIDEISYGEFFVGWVPPRAILNMDIAELVKLVDASEDLSVGSRVYSNKVAEICFIGLASYFEAFCKNQFAAIINICPQILCGFIEKRGDAAVSIRDLLKIMDTINFTLGSLLSEKYDFGAPKAVNGLYYDLLGITPFSSTEIKKYDEFLGDRNLLVHHRGVYTFKYHGQRLSPNPVRGIVHSNSLVIKKEDFKKWVDFFQSMAEKIVKEVHKSMKELIKRENIALYKVQEEAIEYILWE